MPVSLISTSHWKKKDGQCLGVAVFLLGLIAFGGGRVAHGQADSTQASLASSLAEWSLLADGRSVDWPSVRAWPLDSLRVAARDALGTVQRQGYYFARIDSHHVDTSRTPPQAQLFVTRGPNVPVGRIRLDGAVALDSLVLLSRMETRPGRTLDPERLEADLEDLLALYEEAGFLLTQIQVQDIALMPEDPPRLDVSIRIDEGGAPTLRRVEIPGAARTRLRYVARVAELRPGRPLSGYDPAAIRQRLEATGFFRDIGLPELLLEGDSGAVVRIPMTEEAPGAFDLVLGYQPPADGQGGGNLVGNGHLVFRNLFGGGRRFSLELSRPPGQVSRVDVRAADPFILGLPLSIEGRFEGLQQDSTYGKRGYGLEVGYRFEGGLQLFSTINREVTRPGLAGVALRDGRQKVPLASAFFAGLGVRVHRVDRRINPRRGFVVETNFEQGRKERRALRVTAEQDTTDEQSALRQERLRAQARLYLPTVRRQVLVLGGEALLLRSNEFDESDLFRFGGATSLRGYDEEEFRVPFATRLLVEYRYQLDRASYGFAFFDLGYVERSKTINLSPLRGFYPGFGIGFQIGTDLGLINLSLASNSDEPTGVRAHLGLSIGL